MALQMNLNGPPRAILSLGSDDQRRRYLPGACDGSRYFVIAMTEPQAGSDGLNLQTTLTSDGSGFRLSGTKCFITGGARADTYLVFCRAPGTVGTPASALFSSNVGNPASPSQSSNAKWAEAVSPRPNCTSTEYRSNRMLY